MNNDLTSTSGSDGDNARGTRLDELFATLPAGLIYFDADLRIRRINPAGARAIGARVPADELLDRSFYEAATAGRQALAPAFAAVRRSGQPLTFWGYPVPAPATAAAAQTDTAASEADTFWDYTLCPLDAPAEAGGEADPGGNETPDLTLGPQRGGVLLFAVEVTARVLAERGVQSAVGAAQQAANKLQALVEQMADGVIVSDRTGAVATVNHAALGMLGAAATALAPAGGGNELAAAAGGAQLRGADGVVIRPEEFPWRRAVAEGAESRNVELVIAPAGGHGPGETTILSVNATPLRDERGQITGAVAVLRDVSESRHLIEELRATNRRLEELGRLKDEFVANMSHELRTPLTAIIGFAQLMQMKSFVKEPVRYEDASERILRNSRHLLSLIDDVLDLSKLEVGRVAIHPDHIDLAETVRAAFNELQSLAEQKQLRYRLDVLDELPPAYLDPLRVRQILINLLSNALKFTTHGEVAAEVRRAGADEWQLSARDSGIGIKPEALGFIFERFRQVDGSTTRNVGGVGLGLTIVRQLVDLLGGRVAVVSTPGEGTTFTVTLPFSLEPSGAVPRSPGTDDIAHGEATVNLRTSRIAATRG